MMPRPLRTRPVHKPKGLIQVGRVDFAAAQIAVVKLYTGDEAARECGGRSGT